MKKSPRSNLPTVSTDWGREIEEAYRDIDSSLQLLESDVEIRELAASADLLAANLKSLNNRQPQILTPKTGIVLTAPTSSYVSNVWFDWSFVSKRNQSVLVTGYIKQYNQVGGASPNFEFYASFINIFPAGTVFYIHREGTPVPSGAYTESFIGTVNLQANKTYSIQASISSGGIFGGSSATYDVGLAVFPE